MRLLNVKRLLGEPNDPLGSQDPERLLITTYGADIPTYAILSHKWFEGADSEIQFADIQHSSGAYNGRAGVLAGDGKANAFSRFQSLIKEPRLRRSAEKIRNFCIADNQRGYEWVWDDTFCISDASESEKSESITSMYRWYKQAGKCFAFLMDVEWSNDRAKREAQFRQSVWFTRGWTLQELLAPTALEFFDRDWRPIGSRHDLAALIQEACGIDSQIVDRFDPKSTSVSVATRLSWASHRNTSKPEDRAYSLFGLFNVSTFIRYGEELPVAFRRLQEAIISQVQDESIFAWRASETFHNFVPSRNSNDAYGLLALSIDWFADSADIHERPDMYRSRGSYSVSNGVLHFPVPIKFVGGGRATGDLIHGITSMRNKRGRIIEMPIECWTHPKGSSD